MSESKDNAALREQALALHRSGDLVKACAIYQALLLRMPENGDILGLLGLAREHLGDAQEAKRLFERALADRTAPDAFYRNLNNLVGLFLDHAETQEAMAAITAALPMPAWPVGGGPGIERRPSILSLMAAAFDLKLYEAASEIAQANVAHFDGEVRFALIAGSCLLLAGRPAQARLILGRVAGEGPADGSIQILRAAAAFQAGDLVEAETASVRFVAMAPTLILEPRPSQIMTVAVLNAMPQVISRPGPPFDSHFSVNYPSQMAQRYADRYRFLSIFADGPAALESLRDLPKPDLVVNNCANSERVSVGESLRLLTAVADMLGAPVVNHPNAVFRATRQRNAERFGHIPGVIVPATARYVNAGNFAELTEDIEKSFRYPFILRTVFGQMGTGASFVAGRLELAKALQDTIDQQIYVLQYIDCRHDEGFHRKMRVGFAGGECIMLRVDHSDFWSIIGRRQKEVLSFYERRPDMAILSNDMARSPQNFFEPAVFEKLKRVGQSVQLDIFGLDFDVTKEGDIVVFEANAAMNLIAPVIATLNYPTEPEEHMIDAIHRTFHQTAGKPYARLP